MASFRSLFNQAVTTRFRFIIGYGIVIALLMIVIGADISNTPNGLSQAEMNQAVTSSQMSLNMSFDWAINGIYNFIQKLSIDSFGLSRLSLVIPSLIFGIATVMLFALTMRHWFRDSVSVVSTAIFATSIPFISMLRSGTPEIMLPFWTILLLYAAIKLLVKREHAMHWKLLVLIASVGLLYTPLGIYPLISIFGSAVFHPHVRSRVRHIKHIRMATLITVFIIGLIPLALYTINHPGAIATATGFETMKASVQNFNENIAQIYDIYLNFRKSGFSGTILVPVFNLATIAIAVLGMLKSIRDRYTARSYTLITWSIVTVVLLSLMPSAAVLAFMPVMLLAAIGIDALITEWYGLFPRNPYARVAGLIPLVILFIGIAAGNISHYFNNQNHITNPFYSESLVAVKKSLVIEGDHTVVLVAKPSEKQFYELLVKEHRHLKVTTKAPEKIDVPVFILPNADQAYAAQPSRIVSSPLRDTGVALRVYRPQ